MRGWQAEGSKDSVLMSFAFYLNHETAAGLTGAAFRLALQLGDRWRNEGIEWAPLASSKSTRSTL